MRFPIALLLLLKCFTAGAQLDTIHTITGIKIACKIIDISDSALRYRPVGGWRQTIPLRQLSSYTYKRERYTLRDGSTSQKPEPLNTAVQTTQPDKTAELQAQVGHMQACLRKSHEEFRTGLILVGASMVLSFAVSQLNQDSPTGRAGIYVTSALGITGLIMMIDSHKWINRAGQKKKLKIEN